MGDYFDWWWQGGDWYDLRQREELGALAASHARTTSRLSSKLQEERQRSDGLGVRLGRLEQAVVALVELEDLRGVMENFSDAAATRRYARDVLAGIPALGRVPGTQDPPAPPDVPGYWLHPAVAAVAAQLDGDEQTARTASDEARRRDPMRTAQFLAAVAILRGSHIADDDLATLWPTTRQVSTYQRQLWLAVAEGGLGEDARESLTAALAWVLHQVDGGAQPTSGEGQPFVQVRQPRAPAPATSRTELVTSGLLARRSPSDAVDAAAALEDLRTRVDAGLAAARIDPDHREVPAGVADLLAQVVSAGAPDEEPLVARIVEIRTALAAVGASTSIAAPALLDEQALDVVELVRSDLGEAAAPGARAVAIGALRQEILELAEQYAERAAQPLPDGAELRLAGGITVAVTSAGAADAGWRDRLQQRVVRAGPDTRPAVTRAIVGGVIAVLGLVLGIVAAPGWLVLLVPGLGLAGQGWWERRAREQESAERVASTLAKADAAVRERTQQLGGSLIAAQERQRRAPADLATIRSLLA